MTDRATELEDLLARAEELPYGPARLAVHEEAISFADLHRDESLAFRARKETLWPAYRASRPDLLLVHYAWCLAYADRHPNLLAEVLWEYRWVIDSMPEFAEIPRSQIEDALTDMARRYRAAGYSTRAVHVLRRRIGIEFGDRAMAADAHRRIARAPQDEMSDDEETEAAFRVYYLDFLGRTEQTIAAATPFLDGRFTDPSTRIGVNETLLLPLTRLGRIDQARSLQKEAVRLTASRPEFLGSGSDQILFLAIIGDLAGGLRLLDRHFPPGVTQPGRLARFDLCRAARFLADRLTRAGRNRSTVRVPPGHLPEVAGDRAPVPVLAEWLDRELQELAAIADARNQTGYFTEKLQELTELHELADRLARERKGG